MAGLVPSQIEMARDALAKQYSSAISLSAPIFADAVKTLIAGVVEQNAAIAGRLSETYKVPNALLGAASLDAFAELGRSQGFWKDYSKSFQLINEDLERSKLNIYGSIAGIMAENDNWTKQLTMFQGAALGPAFYSGLLESTKAFQTSVAQLSEGILENAALGISESMRSVITFPSIAFSKYARRTVNRIAKEKNELDIFGYSTGLRFADAQIETSSSILTEILRGPIDGINEYQQAGHPTWNLFRAQQTELRSRSRELSDREGVDFQTTIAGTINVLVINCIKKWTYINRNGLLKGLEEIFPPTTTIVESAALLPGICPGTQDEFATAIDYLYFTFYEGAGAANLRFITSGLVSAEEIDAIMFIKMFRNKWLRHDPDHGSAADIRNARNAVAETLVKLGFNNLPRGKHEFAILHRNLLIRLERFLDLLIERLDARPLI